jgi:hypothetical protein
LNDQQKTTTICKQYNFSDINDVAFFLRGVWYGSDYMQEIMASTQLTADQYDAFYDSNSPNSFGSSINSDQGKLKEFYNCPQAFDGHTNYT